jgi:hypothetical protein
VFTPKKVELVVVSLIHILRHSEELQRGVRGRCIIVSFRENPNSFRLT